MGGEGSPVNVRRQLALGLAEGHPEDAAAVLEALGPDAAAGFLAGVPHELAARVLRRTTAHPASTILSRLPLERAAEIVAHLPVDVSAGYLRRLDAERRDRLVASLSQGRARALRALLRHREGTAGALMDPEVLALPDDLAVREAVERVRASAAHARYNLYVVDRDDRLVGVLNLRELLLARPRERLAAIAHHEVMRVAADTDARAIAAHPGWREVHSLPVVDESGVYLGALRYRTLRSLEDESRRSDAPGDLTARALGDLFWTGVSGVIDAIAGAPADPTRARSGTRGGR